MTRPDLLALTTDALVAVANRGLVKRAVRELDAGAVPVLSTAADGALQGVFPDGVRTGIGATGLGAAHCTCGAVGMCRHVVAVVLAHQRGAAAPPPFAAWSPGDVGDEALTAAFGPRALVAARRLVACGLSATVRRPTADDPVATVALPTCTVRFLVPGALDPVDTDAAAPVRAQLIVVAVWTCRAADQQDPDRDAALVRVELDGSTGRATGSAVAAADEVLTGGVVHGGPVRTAELARARDALDALNLRWPVAVLDELTAQLAAHADRAAGHSARRVAELVAEVHARHRVGTTAALGTDEIASTPLRRARFVALGCRVTDSGAAEVYLADVRSGEVLVHRQEFTVTDTDTGADLARRRVAGVDLARFACANVLTDSAVRSASRHVRIPTRTGTTSVTPVGRAWFELPRLVTDVAALAAELAALPPLLVRPRVAAASVRVLAVAGVRDVAYAPGEQRLDAVVLDAAGAPARVRITHRARCPGALDATADALAAGPLLISGLVRRVGGEVVVDPVAVATDDGVVVVDLAARAPTSLRSVPAAADPLGAALDSALDVLAEAAHRGLAHLPSTFADRVAAAVGGLTRIGLHRGAAALSEFGAAPGPERWATAQIRLMVTAEHSGAVEEDA